MQFEQEPDPGPTPDAACASTYVAGTVSVFTSFVTLLVPLPEPSTKIYGIVSLYTGLYSYFGGMAAC